MLSAGGGALRLGRRNGPDFGVLWRHDPVRYPFDTHANGATCLKVSASRPAALRLGPFAIILPYALSRRAFCRYSSAHANKRAIRLGSLTPQATRSQRAASSYNSAEVIMVRAMRPSCRRTLQSDFRLLLAANPLKHASLQKRE